MRFLGSKIVDLMWFEMTSINFYPEKPTSFIQPNGVYWSTRTLGDTPLICPECKLFTWTIHGWNQYTKIGVCSACFGKVKKQGGVSEDA